ncbi:methylated-DNA--[bacterium]|nr:methylated-DNA--[protein]-cysteine S-methyltransferase [bacterium]
MQYKNYYQSPLGEIFLTANETSLTGLWFVGAKYFDETSMQNYKEKKLPIFEQTKNWLDLYFEGKEPNFTPPVYQTGSSFKMAVWKILKDIPYGKTVTYSEIAAIIAKQKGIIKMSAQAIGGAVAHNTISIIIPCHRVIGANGSLTGYAGGINKKIKLLELEKINIEKFLIPTKGTAL